MNRTLASIAALAIALLTASVSRADETFPVAHTEPITVHVLDGATGLPLPNAHVLLLGGYDQSDIVHRTWPEEALTDAHGDVQLSNQLANLPFLEVRVAKAQGCQAEGGPLSVELIRRDGVIAGNRCGEATAENKAGVVAVFIKVKKSDAKREQFVSPVSMPAGLPSAEPAVGQQLPVPQLDFQPALPEEPRNSAVLEVNLRLAGNLR